MRVALVVHGLPPHARTGVETHTAALAGALAAEGVAVEVFVPRFMPGLALFAQRREDFDDGWAVTWVSVQDEPAPEDMAAAFGAFLDRERPDVVHFQHLLRIGLGAVDEAQKRGLPTLYNAHDFYPARDTYTLMRPDLTAFESGDDEAEARCVLARRFLDGIDGIGDYHGTVLERQLNGEAWGTLRALLHDDDGSPLHAELPAARAAVGERGKLKRGAFAALDARFATSRFLARRLSAAMGRAVEWRASGIDAEPLGRLQPARVSERPLRIGYVGGILKHKGVHVLLDAFAQLEPGTAELILYGDSGDRPYVLDMRARAAEVGAVWGGPFDQDGLPAILTDIDVIVVPSLWSENAPFVIREAFAARRPVIASRTPATEESVRDGEDGILFPLGDANALAEVLRELIADESRYARLALACPSVKSIAAEAREWVATYDELVRARRAATPKPALPAHLESFAARYEALRSVPTRELFSRVMEGLGRLGSAMGVAASPEDYLAIAVGRGSRLRDGLTEDARAIDWLTRSVREQEEARKELEERSVWYADQTSGLQQSLDALERERDWHKETRAADEESRSALDAALEEARNALAALEEERGWLKETLEAGNEELEWLRGRVDSLDEERTGLLVDREALEGHFQSLGAELEQLTSNDKWLRGEIAELVRGLGADLRGGGASEPGTLTTPEISDALTAGRRGLARIVDELAWRRKEMAVVRSASEGLFQRVVGGSLAYRARSWPVEGNPEQEPRG
ncbi:MAG: glycosyltransferase [bacterium]|nr:glycosyltransferase [bacterium]